MDQRAYFVPPRSYLWGQQRPEGSLFSESVQAPRVPIPCFYESIASVQCSDFFVFFVVTLVAELTPFPVYTAGLLSALPVTHRTLDWGRIDDFAADCLGT